MLRVKAKSIATVAIMALAIAMRFASEASADISYLLLAMFALLGRAQAIQALAMSWLFTMLNPGLAPDGAFATIGRFAVLAGAAASVALRTSRPDLNGSYSVNRSVLLTLLLGLFIILHSLLFSSVRDVSILKAVAWTGATATLLSAWAGLDSDSRARVEAQIFGGLILVSFVSLPFALSGVGYLRNGTGFQGILNHPQAFGPMVAILGAWGGSKLVAQRSPDWRLVGLFVICLILVIMSEARTAALALILSITIAGVIGSILSRRSYLQFLPGLTSPRLYAVLAIGLIGVVVTGAQLSARIDTFLAKRSDSAGILQSYAQSRGKLIDQMIDNVTDHPLVGIGFGVGSDPAAMDVAREPVFGLPTGAPIEKGVLPLAVLEEIGIFGFVLVALWLFRLVKRAARWGGVVALAVSLVVLFMNMGESILFSVGGMGLLPLILFTWAATFRPQGSGAQND